MLRHRNNYLNTNIYSGLVGILIWLHRKLTLPLLVDMFAIFSLRRPDILPVGKSCKNTTCIVYLQYLICR